MSKLLTALALTVAIGAPGVLYANDAPIMTNFSTFVTPGNTLLVRGDITDEDLEGVTVYIDWLGAQYTTVAMNYTTGHWEWYIGLEPGDEAWVSAVAKDSEGLSSSQPSDLITPLP